MPCDAIQRVADLLIQLDTELDGYLVADDLKELEQLQLAAQADLSTLLLRLAEQDEAFAQAARLRLDGGN